jgi:precorrin-2 dehydrogenase/sirohydrochlorin ferrochelatase
MPSWRAEPHDPVNVALPLLLHLGGRRCVVVGGGPVGTRRATRLGEHGAEVVVISPQITPGIAALHERGAVAEIHRREYASGDLDGCLMAVAATSERTVNAQVARDARVAGVLCNVADAPSEGDVTVPASASRGRLTMAVATAGASPIAAGIARDRALAALGPGWEIALDVLAELRPELAATYSDASELRGAVERLLDPATLAALAAADDDADVARTALGLRSS